MTEDKPPQLGRRIAVVGCSGSGKSTMARTIAQAKGIPWINADGLLFCDANWTERPKAEYYELIEQHIAAEAFVYDGNIGGSAQIVLPRIDTLVWLDYPKPLVMRRLLGRTIRRAWTKEPLYSGSRESWRMSFASRDSILLYAWRSYHERKAQYTELFRDLPGHITPIHLKTPAQADRLCQTLASPGS